MSGIIFNIHLISTIILYDWRWKFAQINCLLGRKIGSLATQPEPTVDWHHVVVFVVISFDDSENPHNQIASSFDFYRKFHEIPGSPGFVSTEVVHVFCPAEETQTKRPKALFRATLLKPRAREKNPPQNCHGFGRRFCLDILLKWPYYPSHVSFQWQKPPNFLFGHWTSSQNCCVDTCGNQSHSKHRRFGMFLSVVSMFVAHTVDGRNYAMDGHKTL